MQFTSSGDPRGQRKRPVGGDLWVVCRSLKAWVVPRPLVLGESAKPQSPHKPAGRAGDKASEGSWEGNESISQKFYIVQDTSCKNLESYFSPALVSCFNIWIQWLLSK